MAASYEKKEVSWNLIQMPNLGNMLKALIVCTCLTMSVEYASALGFTKTDTCSGKFDNGSSLSLQKLLVEDLVLKKEGYITAIVVADVEEYYYQPCVAIDTLVHKELPAACTGMASCQLHIGQYYANGLASTASFTIDTASSNLTLSYTAAEDRKTDVLLVCDPGMDIAKLEFVGEEPTKHFHLILTSKFACSLPPSGLSAGSVLLIIFFVCVCVYFVGGLLFMKFVRGAVGKEIMPNNEFWSDLPYLIRDGFLFLANGCKSDATYDQI